MHCNVYVDSLVAATAVKMPYLEHTGRNRIDGPTTKAECLGDTSHQLPYEVKKQYNLYLDMGN
ncbi:hypothetical protein IHE44_0013166 [Lamprotornis superbus]|uniref:Uncharacterized protein n=1 Tax=Lamprotornis superbus TaxID=245042 RepID=A0A835NG50_9PASS|nr:hypothetical protein IHE44_0013166 [Lamprotornis superbus]